MFRPLDAKSALESLGFAVGGCIPIGLALFYSEVEGYTINPEAEKVFIVSSFLYLIVGIICFLFIHSSDGVTEKSRRWISVVMYIQAAISLVIVHVLVSVLGGVKESVFSFSYLYIPAVVGFIYGGAGCTLLVTSTMCGLLFIQSAIYPSGVAELLGLIWRREFDFAIPRLSGGGGHARIGPTNFDWSYVGVFIIQLSVTTYLAPRGSLAAGEHLPNRENV